MRRWPGSQPSAPSPVTIAPDGSFVTPPLNAGTYILQLVRTPQSFEHAEAVVGFRIVDVGTSDVSGITVDVRRDTAIRGRFRMESDDPAAEWPTHIGVSAYLALEGMPLGPGIHAEGAPAGEFVLRNAFGPRVLRCGWALASLAPVAVSGHSRWDGHHERADRFQRTRERRTRSRLHATSGSHQGHRDRW